MELAVTAFLADTIIAAGSRDTITRDLEQRYPDDLGAIAVFDNATGRAVDLDYWDALATRTPRSAGRPRLGVQAREVTLLPRHWAWLATQPGGASATLRWLVDAAERGAASDPRARKEAGYWFLQSTSGNRAGYEDAIRALYRDDEHALRAAVADWPADVRSYFDRLRGAAAA